MKTKKCSRCGREEVHKIYECYACGHQPSFATPPDNSLEVMLGLERVRGICHLSNKWEEEISASDLKVIKGIIQEAIDLIESKRD